MNLIVVAVLATALSLVFLAAMAVWIAVALKVASINSRAAADLKETASVMNATATFVVGRVAEATTEVKAILSGIPDIAKGMDEAKEAVLTLPVFARGLAEITKEQVLMLGGVKMAVDRFRALVGNDDGSGVQEYDESKAAIDDEVLSLMERGGMSQKEAEDRVKQKRVYANFSVEN